MGKKIVNKYINKGDYYELHINGGKYGYNIILFDSDDYERVKQYNWTVNKYIRCKKCYYYAVSSHLKLMHRFIMNASKGQVVDHINGVESTLDNRKYNLNICSQKENVRKSELSSNNKSGHVGVCWYKNTGQWMAYIMVNRKFINLGYFDDINKAIETREKAEITYFGEFTPLRILNKLNYL